MDGGLPQSTITGNCKTSEIRFISPVRYQKPRDDGAPSGKLKRVEHRESKTGCCKGDTSRDCGPTSGEANRIRPAMVERGWNGNLGKETVWHFGACLDQLIVRGFAGLPAHPSDQALTVCRIPVRAPFPVWTPLHEQDAPSQPRAAFPRDS